MLTRRTSLILAPLVLVATAAGAQVPNPGVDPGAALQVLEVTAEDYAFRAPDQVQAGWTTVRLLNEGEEHHFVVLLRLPDGRTYDDYLAKVGEPFNQIWYQMRDGHIGPEEAMEQLGADLPEWFWATEPRGGAGLLLPGGTAEVTVNLHPGEYVLECYMKTPEGEFHAMEGMVRGLTVLDRRAAAGPPSADVRLSVRTDGIDMVGMPATGRTTFRVTFAEHPAGGPLTNALHLARLNDDGDVEQVVQWTNWVPVEGLMEPAPAEFVGGLQPKPEGEHGYFTVDLEPGTYLLVSEAAGQTGAVRQFTVR
jgi:hypothetical protein